MKKKASIAGILFSLIALSIVTSSSLADVSFEVDIYKPAEAYNGTTLLADNFNRQQPRIIEIDMNGEIVWEYDLPGNLKRYTNPGFDVELLPTNTVLFLLPGKGIYEINRDGQIIWSHLDPKVSHDADRLPGGNTIYVFGHNDQTNDAQVKEIDAKGNLVWSWHAKHEFKKEPYEDIFNQGWTHTNAVTRMNNGNTLISPRNFNCLLEVDPDGGVVDIIGEEYLEHAHDPEILPNGNILVANHQQPHSAIEIDKNTDTIIWSFDIPEKKVWPVRDANRLPNGNILITGTAVLLEVTPEGEIVWRLKVNNPGFRTPKDAPALGFYKAQRILK